jgi:hypothetical protein
VGSSIAVELPEEALAHHEPNRLACVVRRMTGIGTLMACLLAACGGSSLGPSDGGPLDASDDAAASRCNPITNAGCATGERCTYVHEPRTGERVGLPGCQLPGTAGSGGACIVDPVSLIDDCARAFCVSGVCRDFCTNSPNTLCNVGYCPTDAAGTVCFAPCDPLAPDECSDGESCYPPPESHEQTPGCAPTGVVTLGQPCVFPHDCEAGLTCIAGAGATCVEVCDLQAAACGDGFHCAPWSSTATFGTCAPDGAMTL